MFKILLVALLFLGCDPNSISTLKKTAPVVAKSSGGIFASLNIYNEEARVFVCGNDGQRVVACRKVLELRGVDGRQIIFNPEKENSLKIRIPIEPSWQGTVQLQRGNLDDPRTLQKKLPYGRLEEGENAYVDIDFIPCSHQNNDIGTCLDYDSFESLADYSGVYQVVSYNGKVPARSALFLIAFGEIDKHTSAEIRMFDGSGEELINGSTKDSDCLWFTCKTDSLRVLTTPRSYSTWTVREKDDKPLLVRAYRTINTELHEVASNTGNFKLTHKGYEYTTYYLDDRGRMKKSVVRRK